MLIRNHIRLINASVCVRDKIRLIVGIDEGMAIGVDHEEGRGSTL